jgi:hypothetical protein
VKLERQLKETLLELSTVQLIIKLLRKETEETLTTECSRIRMASALNEYEYREDNNHNKWSLVTSMNPDKSRKQQKL